MMLRVEIYLPLEDNEGAEFSEVLFEEAADELVEKFGAVSSRNSKVDGLWMHEGRLYPDRLREFFLIVDDNDSNRDFLREFKEKLQGRFRQIEIMILASPVDWL